FPLGYALWQSKVTFVQGKVESIDFKEKFITLADGQKIDFEYLVIALGSETNYFGIPGLKEHSYPLKNLYDALHVRDKVISLFQDPPTTTLSFVIAGAGPTGVEFSGELSRWVKHLERTSKKHCSCTITLIDAAAEILPGFEPSLVNKARKRLSKLGVKIITNVALKEVADGKLLLSNGQWLNFDLLVWSGGVKAPDILAKLPHKIEKKGRVEVTKEMLCISTDPHLDIGGKFFTIGDSACFYHPKTGQPIPGIARAAIEQGKVVAYNILADIKKMPRKTYRPMNYPYIIPIGGKWAIARFGPITIYGFFGWILKGLVELFYITSILPLGMAISIWLKGLWIFIKND
ncbi:MAG: NAD(P)/FAD-dependent oxidoreductase, partial [Candidatus Paceibacteria bacterium]